MKVDELREKYLEFFVSKGCTRRPSDVLVPTWDPSVLFTPAGMNQFKDHFLGKCKLEFTRATTCQKCLRTGDIDNVGRTAYHHTFFEMLGNFSFGDYFKKEAIHWAWEFLTSKKWLGLDGERLTVTVYLDDDEAAGIWHNEIGLPTSRITRCGEDENFWPANAPSQGPDGVCGPCSEIYYSLPGGGNVEIWNLVFTQFNRVGAPPNNLRPLPSKNIDTGMGLERCAAVLQGVDTNYHIDSLRPIVEAAAEICGQAYDPLNDAGRRFRRMADHVRACTFAIHENVYPGAMKEKYVIRRLLRRAVLDGRQLGLHAPFLYQLVPSVVERMGNAYPEIRETVDRVQNAIKQEETRFFETIDSGLERIEAIFARLHQGEGSVVPGDEAFNIYQTYGFPPELFETIAADRKLTFDWPAFREAARIHETVSGGGAKGELFKSGPLDSLKKAYGATEFLGYESTEATAEVLGVVLQGKPVDEVVGPTPEGESVWVVLDRTPFYAESGGQMGDRGTIVGEGVKFEVSDTKKDGELFVHIGRVVEGTLHTGRTVTATVCNDRRRAIARAHSATHILHYALHQTLGKHAQQQGSKVEDDQLRFDFTNDGAIKPDDLDAIEKIVNSKVVEASSVGWKRMPIAEARTAGAMMLFGEKYPDVVRMVSVGDFSKELCAGTHVGNTGEIGLVKILREESVSAGTRRITAVTGAGALAYVRKLEETLHQAAASIKASVEDLPARVASMAKEIRDLKKKLAAGPVGGALSPEQLLADAEVVDGVKVVVQELPGATADGLRELIDQLRRKGDPVAVLLASRDDASVTVVAGLSRGPQEKGLDAPKWVRAITPLIGGKGGGGRPDMAQAGGKDPSGLPKALEAAVEALKAQLAAKA